MVDWWLWETFYDERPAQSWETFYSINFHSTETENSGEKTICLIIQYKTNINFKMTSSHKDRQDNPRTKTTKIKGNTKYSNYTLSQFGFQDGTKFSAFSVSKYFVDVLF